MHVFIIFETFCLLVWLPPNDAYPDPCNLEWNRYAEVLLQNVNTRQLVPELFNPYRARTMIASLNSSSPNSCLAIQHMPLLLFLHLGDIGCQYQPSWYLLDWLQLSKRQFGYIYKKEYLLILLNITKMNISTIMINSHGSIFEGLFQLLLSHQHWMSGFA